jgi:23S rRNA (uracil1939-C5)-methyltransferase
MRSSRKAPPSQFEVRIEKLVYGGSGLGHYEGLVVFVPFTAPGDLVKVRATERKKNFVRAFAIEILEPGPGRQEAPCVHFGSCGGCQWQHLEYGHQLEFKRKILEEAFHHNLQETRSLTIEMRRSPESLGYRSQARVQARGLGPNAVVGFYESQTHRVEDIESCPLFHPALNEALAAVRDARRRESLDSGVHELELACSPEEGSWRAAAVLADWDSSPGPSAAAAEKDAEETTLQRRIGEFTYQTTPSVFFQANHFLVAGMVETVKELAQDAGREAALDLYSGIGLFALPMARQFSKVIAVEASQAASRLCVMNAEGAGLENVETVCSEVQSWMDAVGSVSSPAFDLVILDPPRSGAGKDVMERLIEWVPERIVYVSCDPQTLVRDLALLSPRYYRIDFIQGLDMFPHTYHFETIVRLRRR